MKVALQATQVFEETRRSTEERLFSIVKQKMDGFVELADYNWELSQPMSSPSSYLTGFLDNFDIMMDNCWLYIC